ncbi:major facilitator superfamily domain-containing protein [Aspergillus karnatakaensis]|uniref:major facilitator superfamily domain-containing protein n=1 Tax=Aspergillus karnatakaensis TaxID=1810916 RepID=UPI003CCCA5FB
MSEEKGIVDHVEESRSQTGTDTPKGETSTPTYDKEAEARLRRKIDWYIVPTVAIIYLFCFIDRANVGMSPTPLYPKSNPANTPTIGNARLAGFEEDLSMTGHDYNIVLSVFYISYIVFEIPSNIACKWIGPGYFLPFLTVMFGLCSVFTAFVQTMESAAGVRFVLGIFEAGMMPGISYYLSRWYRKAELAFRLSLYLVMAPLAGAFGGLLASGILTLDSVGHLKTWRMIFAVEGIITVGVGLIAFFTLTDRPETARWLTPEEKDLAIARVRSESEHAGVHEVLDKLDKTKLLRGIFNPVTLATSWIMLLACVTVQGLAFFLPTIVRTIIPNESTVQQQLRTVPPNIVGAISTLVIPWLSSRFDRRTLFFIVTPLFMMTGYIIFLATTTAHGNARYGATFLIGIGSFPIGVLCNAHAAVNVVSDTARASSIGTVVMMGNIGGLIATWSFLPFDGPNYPIGNGLNLATGASCLLTGVGMLVWSRWDNQRREKVDAYRVLDGMGARQVEDLEWRHPLFRWRL